ETALELATPATGSGTVTNTGGVLTNNAIVLGAGSADVKVAAGFTFDAATASLAIPTGGVIDFGSGNVTVSHSADTLTSSGKVVVETGSGVRMAVHAEATETFATGAAFAIYGHWRDEGAHEYGHAFAGFMAGSPDFVTNASLNIDGQYIEGTDIKRSLGDDSTST